MMKIALLLIPFFIPWISCASTVAEHYKLMECYEVLAHTPQFKSFWSEMKRSAKNYKTELGEYGVKRLFIRPAHSSSVSEIEEKLGGLIFHDPSYESIKWYLDIERKVFQYVPRKLGKIFAKKTYEFGPFRAMIHKIDQRLEESYWQLSMPSQMVLLSPPIFLFWGGMYQVGDMVAAQIREKKSNEFLWRKIQNDYRFNYIKIHYDHGDYSKELALIEAANLQATYHLYYETLDEYLENGLTLDSKELSAIFILDENINVMFKSLFQRVFDYTKDDFWNSNTMDFEKKKEIDFETLHELIVLNHHKILRQQLVYNYFVDLKNEESLDKYQREPYFHDEFVQKVLSYIKKGIDPDKALYILLADVDDVSRFDELKILGVRYRLPGQENEYLNLDFMRDESLQELNSSISK